MVATNRDININASLGQTTATGPGPAELPDVQVERRDPIDIATAMQQLEGLRRQGGYGGGRRTGGRGYQPNMINGGLVGGRPYMPKAGYNNPSFGGGSGGAPTSDPNAGRVKKYLKVSPGYGGFGGYVPATANEPGAIFAGYMDAGSAPSSVSIGGSTTPGTYSTLPSFTQYQANSGGYVPGVSNQLSALSNLLQRNQ